MLPALLVMATPARTLDVCAASSLREAFKAVASAFEASQSGVKVKLSFAGSQTLAAQIRQGAPADVFASASTRNLKGIQFDPDSRKIFATNRLVVVGGARFIDLAKTPRIVLGASAVPVGGYADESIASAALKWGSGWRQAVLDRVVSRENDVRGVLAKVRLGEADAGIVYASDAKGQPIPAAFQPKIEYPVVILGEARQPELAKAFVKLLLGKAGRKALVAKGFGVPTP